MNTYIIKYYYNTDLRHFEEVQADNEVEALIIANENLAQITGNKEDWTCKDNKNFFVKISRA